MKTNPVTLLILIFCITKISYAQGNEVLMPYIKGDLYGYANSKGEIIVEPKYTYTLPFENGFGRITLSKSLGTNNRYGLINESGQVILEPIASNISPFDSNGLAKIQGENYKYGMINRNGDWIVPLEYTHIEVISGYLQIQNSRGEVALLDLKGQTIIDFYFNQVIVHESLSMDPTLITVIRNNKYGLIQLQNNKYKTIIKPQYEQLLVFKNNLFIAKKEDKFGLINMNNKATIPFEYDGIGKGSGNLIAQQKIEYKPKIKTIKSDISITPTNRGFRNIKKEFDDSNKVVYFLMTEEEQEVANLYGYSILKEPFIRSLYSLLDTTGKVIIPFQLGRIWVYGIHLIGVKLDGNMMLYNEKGERISSDTFYHLESFNNGLWVILSHSKTANDKENNTKYKYGYIDTMGKIKIPLIFDEAIKFNKNLAPVKQKGKWALINKEGTYITEYLYDYLQYTGGNRYAFKKGKLWGLLDLKGKEVLSETYSDYKNSYHEDYSYLGYTKFDFINGLAKVYDQINGQRGTTALIDTNGVQLFPFKYQNIEPLENGLFKVTLWIKELDRERVGLIDKNGTELIPIYQREINWLPIEKVYQVYSQDNIYSYYNQKGQKVASPYKKFERSGLSYYRKLSNGFYAANERDRTVYFTPEGIPLYED